jgi:flagellar biosynthesis GTPase FlhF
MDKPTIQAAVWHAADQLFAAGIRPTVASIREITKRGSAGTINQALKDWWHDLSCRVSDRDRRPDIPEPVADAMCQLWAASLERAERSLHVHRVDAERQVKEASASQAAAERSAEQAQRQCRLLEEQLADLRLSYAALQRQLAAEAALRSESDSRIRDLRAEAAKSMADMHASIMRLEKQGELEKERYQSMERSLAAQADESKLMRRQAEKRLADLHAASASIEAHYREQILEYQERCARQSERGGLLEQRISMLEHDLKQAAERAHALMSENMELKSLASRALVPTRTSPRFKAARLKKRRY